jgi:hypothetical protein
VRYGRDCGELEGEANEERESDVAISWSADADRGIEREVN